MFLQNDLGVPLKSVNFDNLISSSFLNTLEEPLRKNLQKNEDKCNHSREKGNKHLHTTNLETPISEVEFFRNWKSPILKLRNWNFIY